MLALEQALNAAVVGQPAAVAAVAAAIRMGRLGLQPRGRPTASFLFTGPDGVGKSTLCKVAALPSPCGRRSWSSQSCAVACPADTLSGTSAVPEVHVRAQPGRRACIVREWNPILRA